MANTFKNYTSRNIGTSATAIGGFTASTQTTVIGLTVSNTLANTEITVDVSLYNGSNDTFVVKNAPIPVGSSLVVVGGNQKVVLENGDSIRVTSSNPSSVDAILSVLEIA